MPTYSIQQIAAGADRPYITFYRHLKKLIAEKKFVKKSPGKKFSERELALLEKIMDFKYVKQKC